MAVFEIGQLL